MTLQEIINSIESLPTEDREYLFDMQLWKNKTLFTVLVGKTQNLV